MRKLLVLILLAPLSAAAAEPQPQPAFQPLAFLVGHCWKGTFPDGKQTDEHCFQWVYGGRYLRDVHTLRAPGRPDHVGESVYYVDPSSKKIRYLYFEDTGGISHGNVSVGVPLSS